MQKGKDANGRVSDWLIEMEEDAFCMTRDEWTARARRIVHDIYNKLHGVVDEKSHQRTTGTWQTD